MLSFKRTRVVLERVVGDAVMPLVRYHTLSVRLKEMAAAEVNDSVWFYVTVGSGLPLCVYCHVNSAGKEQVHMLRAASFSRTAHSNLTKGYEESRVYQEYTISNYSLGWQILAPERSTISNSVQREESWA